MFRLKQLREAKGMSIAELAAAAGVTRQHIGKLEKGEGNPTHELLQRISLALECSVADIADDSRGERLPQWSVRERQMHLQNIQQIVARVGKDVMSYRGKVEDTTELHGHASSVIDAHAQSSMVQAFPAIYDASRISANWVVTLEFEDGAVTLSAHWPLPQRQ